MNSIFKIALVLSLPFAASANAHIYDFVFGMWGGAVVPPNQSAARGTGLLEYNHHTFNYDLDLFITGIELEDLLPTGPNGTPLQIFNAPRGETGDIVLDPGFFGDFVQDGDGIRLTLSTIRLGAQQGSFSSNIFNNEEALYDGHLYIQLFTTQYPDGELRGQIPPLGKFLQSDDPAVVAEIDTPPEPIPSPAPVLLLLAAGLGNRRRRH